MKRAALLAILTTLTLHGQSAPHASDAPLEDSVVFRTSAHLIEAYATVFDKHGSPIPNLSIDAFTVLDNGQPQKLTAYEGSEDSLSCAILLDITGSMEDFLPTLKNSVSRFLDELPADQDVAIYTFSKTVQLVQSFTLDRRAAKQAVMRSRAGGATALFDAVARVSQDLETRKGKKALVLFTDGNDNASSLTAAGASRRARLAGVPVYTIAEGEALDSKSFTKVLEDMSSDTGGLALAVRKPADIGDVFTAISKNLKNTYLLAWKVPENPGTAWRTIKVTLPNVKDAEIRVRQGYEPPQ